MLFRFTIFIFATLPSAAVCLLGCADSGYDLRQARPQAGDVIHEEMSLALKGGTITMQAAEQRIEGDAAMTTKEASVVEVLKMDGNSVTRYKQSIATSTSATTWGIAGRKVENSEHDVLEGETILHQFQAGKWNKTLSGKSPSAAQQARLMAIASWESENIFPEKNLNPGDTWTVDGARLKGFLASGVQSPTGKAEMRFEKVVEFRGESCALIHVALDLKGKTVDAANNELKIEFVDLQGSVYRSLTSGLNLEAKLAGRMTMTGSVVDDNVETKIVIAGPVTAIATQAKQ